MLADPTDYGNKPGDGPLRPGGVAQEGLPAQQQDLPSTLSPAAQKQVHALTKVRDLWGGNDQVKRRGTVYLPQAPGEHPQDYNERLNRAVFFNAFRRTVEGLTGLVFRVDPVLSEDVPPQIVEHWENIDNAGTHGDVFSRDLLQDALTAGHTLLLVEYPDTGGQKLTLADEAPLRPYWVPIKKENVLSWRTAVIGGRTVLTQLVVRECQYVADGAFGEREQERYRVFYNADGVVGWRLLEIDRHKVVRLVGEGTYPTQQEIPIAEIVTSGRRGMFESDPPLYDLACLNIAHYQQWSDAAWSRYKTCVPVLFGAGIQAATNDDGTPAPEITIGPNSAVMAPDPAATLQYVSHSGASLANCEQALETLKADMGTLGISMLAPQKRMAETAEAKRLDKATSDSALSVTARGLQDGLERALGFHARYLGLDSGGSIEINRDFEGLAMDPAVMTALVACVAQGLPWEPVIRELQKGGRLPEDIDPVALALEIQADEAARRAFQQEQNEARMQQFGQNQESEAA